MKLKTANLRALKEELERAGEINSATQAGPVPNEEMSPGCPMRRRTARRRTGSGTTATEIG
eukprot:3071606-Pyramimonas_sp.AAC.1